MKAYVASRFTNRILVAAFMLKCRTMRTKSGEQILFTNTWHTDDSGRLSDHEYQRECAVRDLRQLDESDTIILLTEECHTTPGGMHFEAGYAYVWGKRLIVVGPRVHIFYHMDCVEWYPSIQEYFTSVFEARP